MTQRHPQWTLGQNFKYEGIIEKNSYECGIYESVDDSSLSKVVSRISIEEGIISLEG